MNNLPLFDELLGLLSGGIIPLADKPEETPRASLVALWHAASGSFYSVEAAQERPMEDLSSFQITRLKELVNLRLSGVPLAYLTGIQRFMGLDFVVGPKAVLPRKETEILGNTALRLIKECMERQKEAVFLDVCTGVGNIPIALALSEPKASIYASDISQGAIELAIQNASKFKVENRIVFKIGDLFGPFRESLQNRIDIISCNPPYISTGRLKTLSPEIINHEPLCAFDGGPFGIKILARMIKESLVFLKQGGYLCIEVGVGQGPGMMNLIESSGQFESVANIKDNNNVIRVVFAKR